MHNLSEDSNLLVLLSLDKEMIDTEKKIRNVREKYVAQLEKHIQAHAFYKDNNGYYKMLSVYKNPYINELQITYLFVSKDKDRVSIQNEKVLYFLGKSFMCSENEFNTALQAGLSRLGSL